MKKLALLFCSLFVACKTSKPAPLNVPLAQSSLARDTSPNVSTAASAALASDNLIFSFGLYQQLLAEKTASNLVYSPYSLSVLMAMLDAGAGTQTATTISSVMDFSLPIASLGPAFDALGLSLSQTNTSDTRLNVANSLWADKSFVLNPPFLDTLAVDYGTGVYQQDFAHDPSASENTINAWVSQQTDGLIPTLFSPGQLTAATLLVLVNAIGLVAKWETPFEASSSSQQTFNAEDGSAGDAEFMHAALSANFSVANGYQAVELAYDDNRLVMDLVMPTTGTLAQFEATLSATSFAATVAGFSAGEIQLAMPKFTLAPTQVLLQPALTALGLGPVLTHGDFSLMSPDGSGVPLQIIQQATIAVDENGTKAAAASGGVIAGAVRAPSGPMVTFDHPFFFAIRDTTTATILFAGRVGQLQ